MKKASLVIIIILICMLAVSCAPQTDKPYDTIPYDTMPGDTVPGQTQPDTSASAEVPPATDSNGYLLDGLPEELDWNDATLNILYWNDVEHTEFEVEKTSGELVEDAIYYRNRAVEDRLGVRLSYVGIKGNVSNIAAFVSHVQNTVTAGTGGYDAIGSYSSTGGTLLYNGLSTDLLGLDYLDFDKPWWPEELTGTVTLNGHLYLCSGDISTNLLHMMYATFFNKSYLTDFGIEDPYALVDSGKWTYEAFERMAAGRYSDLDGDNKKSAADRYGYATYWLHLDGLFGGIGIKSVEKDANDLLTISPTYGAERTQSFLEYINGRFTDTNDWYYLGNAGADGKMQQTIFAEGRSLFLTERVRVCQNVLRFTKTDYGILPMPKYDESQSGYITPMAMPYTVYTVPVNSPDPGRSGALLECLASEGYRQVTPALFEVAMKTRYSNDDISSRMYDVVRGCVTFDLGRVFNESLGKIPNATLRNMVQSGSSAWMSKYGSIKKPLGKYLEDINEKLRG